MLKKIILLLAAALWAQGAFSQSHEFANWKRYASANAELGAPAKGENRVVLLGDSITDRWPRTSPSFFADNGFIGRGIGGQTSYQFLLRFREDVINLKPAVVVINYGTNDIAENTGKYDENLTLGNVCSMAELARANGIRVVLTSCLPAGGFGWHPAVAGAMEKIVSLNARVREYARKNNIPYVDYFDAMVTEDGTGMKPEYAVDTPGVHPNAAGYSVMEGLLLPVLESPLWFGSTEWDFGEVDPDGGTLFHSFRMTNVSDRDFRLVGAAGDCSCVRAYIGRYRIKPGETAELKVSVNPAGYSGEVEHTLVLYGQGEKAVQSFSLKFNATDKQSR